MSQSEYPSLFRLRQRCAVPPLADVAAEVERALAALDLAQTIKPADRVAIAIGSRGIANLATIAKALADHVCSLGGEPIIVPAMGSHGGGTAEGQLLMLESLGVTEAACACAIDSSIETVVAMTTASGSPIHIDQVALACDHVIVANRVKPHTSLDGPLQSGLVKMLLIGLGNPAGAKAMHRELQSTTLAELAEQVVPELCTYANVIAGVAILENARDETAHIEAIPPADFLARERELLRQASQWCPRLPFDDVDVLLIDEIGKDYSGTGMDTIVVGRKPQSDSSSTHPLPIVRRILVRGLSARSHGNAIGIGLADFCHARALAAMDRDATRLNALTSGYIETAKLPLDFASDSAMLDAALASVGTKPPDQVRLLWIRNTLELSELAASTPYLAEATARDDLEVLSEPVVPEFDAEGNLA